MSKIGCKVSCSWLEQDKPIGRIISEIQCYGIFIILLNKYGKENLESWSVKDTSNEIKKYVDKFGKYSNNPNNRFCFLSSYYCKILKNKFVFNE